MADIRAIVVRDERQAFFTPDELARYLNLSIRTVWKMLSDGRVPSYTFEGARRIAAEDVDAYVAANHHADARRTTA
jgi:excisionase family DNA binding protein